MCKLVPDSRTTGARLDSGSDLVLNVVVQICRIANSHERISTTEVLVQSMQTMCLLSRIRCSVGPGNDCLTITFSFEWTVSVSESLSSYSSSVSCLVRKFRRRSILNKLP